MSRKATMRTYPQRDLQKAADMNMRGVLLKKVTDAHFSISRRNITHRSKRTRYKKKIKSPGPQTVLTEEVEEDLKFWIAAMQEPGVPVARDMVSIKRYKIFWRILGQKNKKHTRFRAQMATYIHVNISLFDHEVLSDNKEGEG